MLLYVHGRLYPWRTHRWSGDVLEVHMGQVQGQCVNATKVKSQVKRKPGAEVKRSNMLIRAIIPFDSVWELRIIDLVAACVQDNDEAMCEYVIAAKDVRIKYIGGREYDSIKKACSNLTSANIYLPSSKGFAYYALFAKCAYDDGYIKVQIHPDLIPHFVIHKHFTLYKLHEALKIPSKYSKRLFEVLVSYSSLPKQDLELDYLRECLNVPESIISKVSNFDKRILAPAKIHIEGYTSLKYGYEYIKRGRKVVAIKFIFDAESAEDMKRRHEILTMRKAYECYKKKGADCAPKKSKICKSCVENFRPKGNM